MTNNENWKDPCGITNYKDEDHRDDRFENGQPPTTTIIEMRAIEEKGRSITEVQNSGESKSEVNGIDIMNGKAPAIKAFNGGYNSERDK